VIQPGVLQGKPGPSIATEFGLLLPRMGASGVGLSWTGIASQRWDRGTVHFNVDVIIEGPNKWTVQPDSVLGQEQTFSALLGTIWQVRDNLAFDWVCAIR
jgi:hypothetical protein